MYYLSLSIIKLTSVIYIAIITEWLYIISHLTHNLPSIDIHLFLDQIVSCFYLAYLKET